MKKVLKYLDFTFLRLLPTVYIALIFCSGLLGGLLELNSVEFSLLYFLKTNLYVLLDLLLGIISILKSFDKTIKFAKYVQYFLCFIVVVEILISFIFFDIFAKYGNLGVCQYQPTFLGIIDYFRDELECITLLVLVVCCSLKNKFYKTKLILAILVAFLLFISHFILAVYNLWGYIDFRFLFNQLMSLFPSIIVSIIGLAPIKQNKVGNDAHIIPQE
jgi:hypothetical protein